MTTISTDNLPNANIEDNTYDDPTHRTPLVLNQKGFGTVTEEVCGVNEMGTPIAWYIAFMIAAPMAGLWGVLILFLFSTGVGVWGNNEPVFWAFDIVNFVFWVGIGHAGTLISAILFLFRQNWRTGINRFAEAMTIFAVICAGTFPGIHVGRVWLAYWLFPIPNQMGMWPQFRSPLLWDVFAVGTYATVSVLFWYTGMVPDLASLRDRATSKIAKIGYSIFSLGWNGSSRHWHRYEKAYMILAALATPLVLSVHSVVSFDFATSQVPGWHTTIFPPYFVAGAIFGGFAMVVNLAVPARQFYGLQNIITLRHLDIMNKIILATGMIVTYAYCTEFFIAWYSGVENEQFLFLNRAGGPMSWAFWCMITCNCIAPQFFWFKWCRQNLVAMWIIALFANVGMWFERFVIIVISLHRDFLSTSWGGYFPTWVDLGMLAGSFGLFFTLFLLFLRFLPIIATSEIKAIMPEAHVHHGDGHENHGDNADHGHDSHAPKGVKHVH
jgi:molybdopterin-containing oxidoreductase family membrane subunit